MKRYLSDTNSYRSTGNMARVSLERICICICNGPQNFDRVLTTSSTSVLLVLSVLNEPGRWHEVRPRLPRLPQFVVDLSKDFIQFLFLTRNQWPVRQCNASFHVVQRQRSSNSLEDSTQANRSSPMPLHCQSVWLRNRVHANIRRSVVKLATTFS